ncbi:MAG TPA: DegT/DnrJ/EryC1/StrS family aminotransferase, partial [Candidatus Dormibacteraeota bacterium]|nr:DegT/DnrJ/EryC1/StrS family aminotransferase [Candidatus Dormibacteraeota bacterium]
ASNQVVFESYEEIGFNYRMTDLQAAVGREQLKRLPAIIERRRSQAERYHELLADIPRVTAPVEPSWARSNWQSYCVRLDPVLDQRGVMQAMLDAGVSTRRGIMCVHRESAYAVEKWLPGSTLERGEQAQDHSIILPLFHDLTAADQEAVVAALRAAISSRTDR